MQYETNLLWTGNLGCGTVDYVSYDRDYRLTVDGKPPLTGSAHHKFRGDAAKHDPEDFLICALTSCHMLAYLALCARHGVTVLTYEDHASGTLTFDGHGGGRFTGVMLRPSVIVASGCDTTLAMELHERAHEECFIASSCNFPVRHEPSIVSAAVADSAP